MRKLKLQMQTTLDGFVGGPQGELDWMTMDWDDALKKRVDELTDSVDTILMGRKMTDGFVNYWTNAVENPESPEYEFAKKMVDYPKIVFTRTLDESRWPNTVLAKDTLADEIARIKSEPGRDAIVYGGANFVSNLIRENLIDEYYLFVNPTAIGRGLTIFDGLSEKMGLKLIDSQSCDCGVVLNTYRK